MTNSPKTILLSATTPNFFLVLMKSLLAELSQQYELVICCPSNPELQIYCHDLGITFEPFRIQRKPRIIADLITTKTARQLLIKHQPSLTMTFTPKAGLVFSIARILIRRQPGRFVHNFTGLIFPYAVGVRKRVLSTLDRVILRTAHISVAESDGVASQLESLNEPNANIMKIGYGNVAGVDFSRFAGHTTETSEAARVSLDINTDEIIGLFVGRINYDKGAIELVEAFRKISASQPRLSILFAGSLDDNETYNVAFQKAIEREEKIKYLGRRTDIPRLMLAADFVVLPTRREGFSNTGLEAQACGKPLLINDVPGVSETLAESGIGIVMAGNDSATIAKGIKDMLDLLKTIEIEQRIMCIRRIKKHYSRNRVTTNYVEFIEKHAL